MASAPSMPPRAPFGGTDAHIWHETLQDTWKRNPAARRACDSRSGTGDFPALRQPFGTGTANRCLGPRKISWTLYSVQGSSYGCEGNMGL